VRSNPIPHDRVAVENADGAVADSHVSRIDGRILVDLFEAEAGMSRVADK